MLVKIRVNNKVFKLLIEKEKLFVSKQINFRINIFQHFNIFVNILNIQHFLTFFNIFRHLSTFFNIFHVILNNYQH